jgi:AcrR family transcriptional regulator
MSPTRSAERAFPARRRAGGERREEVLKHVVAVLSERGYDRTRFADIAEVAGVAVSTLQFYFGSRDDMLVEALHYSIDREVRALEATSRPEDPPWQRLVALVDRAVGPLTESTWRIPLEFWHASVHDPELRAHGVGLHYRYRRPFIDAIRRGIEQGDFQADDDVEDIVTVLVGILDGLIIPRALEHDYFQPAGVRAVVLRTLAAALHVREAVPGELG